MTEPSIVIRKPGRDGVKHQPATPLPWHTTMGLEEHYRFDQRRLIQAVDGQRNVAKLDAHESHEPDARYIAHASNAYPKLVESLRRLALECQNCEERFAPTGSDALDLLRELGEES